MRRRAFACLLLALGLLFATAGQAPVRAHPHAWIDLRSTLLLDAEGRVTAIEQEWLFDEFYSMFVLDGLVENEDAEADSLMELARRNLENLRAYDYFTEVRADGETLALATVEDYESEMRGARLWMRFVLPLESPVDPRTQALEFSVFDPTYYIEMLHLEGDVIAFRGADSDGCFGEVVPPNPDPEAVTLAQALDRNAEPDSALGGLFAERVTVTCR